jgi:putative transposase
MNNYFNREGVAVEAEFSLPVSRIVTELDQNIGLCVQPNGIRCDNGPEYISSLLATWAINAGIELMFIILNKSRTLSVTKEQ